MPSTIVHKTIHGSDQMVVALKTLQVFLGQPVKNNIDDQARASEIIKLQKYLSTQSASTPSGFKFDPAKVNTAIDDQMLAAKIIEVQIAANLT
jgi:hypothetical protein